jgi:hypothetical protein
MRSRSVAKLQEIGVQLEHRLVDYSTGAHKARRRDSPKSVRRHPAIDRGTSAAAIYVNSIRSFRVTRIIKNNRRPASL